MKPLRLSVVSVVMLLGCLVSAMAGDFEYQAGARAGDPVYTVTDESEFLAALGNNRVVELAGGVRLNLSRVLNHEQNFSDDVHVWDDGQLLEGMDLSVAVSEEVFDGRQLTLVRMHNLTIRGQSDCSIVVEPRYACVLKLFNCEDIRIENLTLGHTEEGYCEGAVLGLNASKLVDVCNCDLYGCGTYGVEAYHSDGFTMKSSIIRDCSYGIMEVGSCSNFVFTRCDFKRNREFELLGGLGSDLCFTDCRFYDNNATSPLFGSYNEVTLNGCVVNHPTAYLGNLERTISVIRESEWNDNVLLYPQERLDIGPR